MKNTYLYEAVLGYKSKEEFQPVDVILEKCCLLGEGGDECFFKVRRTDGLKTRQRIPFHTTEEHLSYQEARSKLGSHMTLYARPYTSKLLFTQAATENKMMQVVGILPPLLMTLFGAGCLLGAFWAFFAT